MTDVFTRKKRSEIMSNIRSKSTKPEMIVRSMLHLLGYRFTIGSRSNRNLPGRPDIILPKYSTVVFVHGCFWHAHKNCKYFKIPKTRFAWWKNKLEGNIARDLCSESKLLSEGWNVVTIWECATRTNADRAWLLTRLPHLIG